MHRHDHKEREPKAFPQYDDAAHIDSAAVAELPPWEQTREPKGDPKATAYTEKYCEEQHGMTNGGGCRETTASPTSGNIVLPSCPKVPIR